MGRARLALRRVRRIPLHRKLIYAALPALALLAGAEWLARRAALPPTGFVGVGGFYMDPHPTRLWWARPGRYQQGGVPIAIRPDGLRATAIAGAPLRFLTLGDSSIFGHGLPDSETLDAKLVVALAARGVAADGYNGGIPGYSSEQSRVLLEEAGWALEPDLLVIGSLWSDARVEPFQDREWMVAQASPRGRLNALLSRTALWRWLNAGEAERRQGMAYLLTWSRALDDSEDRRVPLARYTENLAWMLDGIRDRGGAAVFLAPADRGRYRGEPIEAPYFQAMSALAERRGVPLVDAAEVLRGAGLSADESFVDDMHPSGAGNAAYAEALSAALEAAGWP